MFNIIKKIVFIFILLIIFVPNITKAENYCKCTITYDDGSKAEENVSVKTKDECIDYVDDAWDFGDTGYTSVCHWLEEDGETYNIFGEKELEIAVKDLNQLKVNTPQELIGLLIKSVMGILGTITLIMIIYGGVLWMTSGGNSDKTKKARDIIVWATLGVIMIFASYAILNTIFEVFSK